MTDGAVTILLGTTKGAFLLAGDAARETWEVRGPYCDGWPINHVIGDIETGMLWAGGGGAWHGAGIWRSRDGGSTWDVVRLTRGEMDDWAETDPDVARQIGWSQAALPFERDFSQVWSLGFAHGVLWAGTKPAQLLVSRDQGTNWTRVESLSAHPSAAQWNPGAAGLVLHTIVAHPTDPDRLWVAISAGGVLATEDGGARWEPRNRVSNLAACEGHDHPAAPRDGETGRCVHNMVRAPGPADVLYQQNHHGVWRSRDGGHKWDDVTAGLPSTFGFPVHVHPRDPETLWTLPLNGDSAGRYPPDAAAAVWRSRDAGESWTAQRNGLPQRHCFFTVLRQAMTGDRHDPAGVYFGTNTGSVFASIDAGETWREIARHLPTILAVETLDGA